MRNIITLAFLMTLQLLMSCADDSRNSYYNNPCYTALPYTEQMAIDVLLIDEYFSEQGIVFLERLELAFWSLLTMWRWYLHFT